MSKYIDAEKLRAEIERLKAKYRKDMYKSNYEGLASGYKIEAYNELLPFLDTLSEEPVSEDLEEAANKFALFYDQGTCDGIAQDCSKAGAEWQKKQSKVDLGADIEMEWDSFNKHLVEYGNESKEVIWLDWYSFNDITRYFYEQGKNNKR